MAAVAKPSEKVGVEKVGVETETAQVHRIRITLTSRNVKNLEKGERGAGKGQPDQLHHQQVWEGLQAVPVLCAR